VLDFDEEETPLNNRGAKRRLVVAAPIILVVALITGASFYFLRADAKPPAQLVNIADSIYYPIYYPSRLPSGYSYTDGSAKIQNSFVYYKLHNGTKTITVTQQAVPASSVNLQKLPEYSNLNVPAGPAAIGVSVGNPSAVVAADSTLVNVNSSKGVSKDTVIAVAKNIKPIRTSIDD
jgi:hypothetical protein